MSDLVLAEVDSTDVQGRPVLGFTAYPVPGPFHTGTGTLNLLCGGCRFVLVAQVEQRDAYAELLIRCPACGAVNDPLH
jgi:hypothetical protein